MAVSRLSILPYKLGSLSAKKLAEGLSQSLHLKVRRVRPNGRYRPNQRSLLVNYGSNTAPNFPLPVNTVNRPEACAIAGNKLRAFQAFQQHNVRTPEWTADRAVAQGWLQDNAVVVCRTLLNAHSGRGIVLASSLEQLTHAPLYVKYKKKRKEFRVHVFQGRVIDVSEKRRVRKENRPAEFDGYIRNHANGWVFCRDGIVRPADLDSLAISAVAACGLDFGAVDVIWNEKENLCYVLEVNTAPGLEGTTLERYKQAILTWMAGR